MKNIIYKIAILASFILVVMPTFAQDKEAKIALKFDKVDSTNVCKVSVTSEGAPVKGVSVSLFVKRMLSDLIIGEPGTTDESGMASFTVPKDIPSSDGNLTLVAKIIDDENYKNTQSKGDVNWGVVVVSDNCNVDERSMSAARNRAPVYLITTSIFIITLVWGTLIWAVLQVFKMKRIVKQKK